MSYDICLPLTYFTQYDSLQVYSCCCKWHYLVLFYGWVISHCAHRPHLIHSSVDGHLGCLHVLVLVNRATALSFDTALAGSKSWLSEIWANSPVNASQNHRLLETEGTWRLREASRRQGGMFWDSEVTLLRSLAALWEFFFRQHSKLLWGVLRWC